MALYSIAVFGRPTPTQRTALLQHVKRTKKRFRLDETDMEVLFHPASFAPNPRASGAAVFFGGDNTAGIDVSGMLDLAVPVLPVASRPTRVTAEIPDKLKALNCISYSGKGGPDRVFDALLECLGMLPRQRRVFLSYKRDESTPVAVQLFAELSARQYEVFLDTHSIGAGVDFQENLWHNLCDVDVLLMLDSPSYFKSRWTTEEYGRALAKGIGILRVQWPKPEAPKGRETKKYTLRKKEHERVSEVARASSLVPLTPASFQADRALVPIALDRVCDQLERFRSLAHATRHLGIVAKVEDALAEIGGMLEGMDANRAMQVRLPSGKRMVIQPTVGVPTAVTLHDALRRADKNASAIVYDHVGIKPSWLNHMSWLATSVTGARWIRSTEAAKDLAALKGELA